MLQSAPGVQMQEIPPSLLPRDDDDYENVCKVEAFVVKSAQLVLIFITLLQDPEVRISQRDRDHMVDAENEYYDDENDQDQIEV